MRKIGIAGAPEEEIGAREIWGLYERLWQDNNFNKKEEYFPMQADVGFSFAPMMCSNADANPEICKKWCPIRRVSRRACSLYQRYNPEQ